jgi:hypothetical protein
MMPPAELRHSGLATLDLRVSVLLLPKVSEGLQHTLTLLIAAGTACLSLLQVIAVQARLHWSSFCSIYLSAWSGSCTS